jgi:ring-1,2-phenylacetyl-CoA epoxidase subunit PaaC
MTLSSNERLAEIARKTIKEATYHLKYSSEWMIRLGDGTPESHQKMEEALSDLMPYFEEAFIKSNIEKEDALVGICVDVEKIKPSAFAKFKSVCEEATLTIPEVEYPQEGGKNGYHTEHLGFILAELQFLQRAYPNSNW